MNIFMKQISLSVFIILCLGIFAFSVRGNPGNPTPEELNSPYWKDEGPLELSPERGRYALLLSAVEDRSFWYSLPIARFTTPDLGFAQGRYVSLFAPGVSFLAVPGYVIGKYLGIAQVGSFFMISIVAVLNGLLIREIAKHFGATPLAATIGAFTFLFATPAFAYGVTLYQHHISTLLILLGFYVLLEYTGFAALTLVWFLISLSIPIDYPNVFLMAPLALTALGRSLVIKTNAESMKLRLKFGGLFALIGIGLPIIFFLWFNDVSYGNPFQLSGTLPSVKAIDAQGNPTIPRDAGTDAGKDFFTDPTQQQKSAVGFFKTRNSIRGLYIQFLSLDRGILYYTPVILFGLFAVVYLYKRHASALSIIIGIIAMNICLYALWGDPWGGWAFGSRYLIPTYSLLAVLIGVVLSRWRKNSLVLFVFLIVFIYSAGVNTLGALTSNRNPPLVEILSLESVTGKQERYTFMRNWEFLTANRSKSFFFQTYASDRYTAVQYFWIVTSVIVCSAYFMLLVVWVSSREKKL